MFEKLKEHWQLLTILLILWSFFDLYNYYNNFGIEIQQYISTGEIVLLTLPTLLKGIFIFLAILCYAFLATPSGKSGHTSEPDKFWTFGQTFKNSITEFKAKNYGYGLFLFIAFVIKLINVFVCLFVLAAGCYYLFVRQSFNTLKVTYDTKWYLLFILTLFGILPVVIMISDFFDKPSRAAHKKVLFNNSPVFYFLLIFIINCYLSNKISYILISQGKGSHEVYFKKNHLHFASDSNTVYIGSTSAFIFFRNNKKQNNLVFSRESIDSLVLKKK